MKFERVTDLNVRCSLKVRNLDANGLCASDTCGSHASFAVEMDNGSQMWRCYEHREIRSVSKGKSSIYVKVAT